MYVQGRRYGLVVQRANSLMGGRAFDPEPRQPLFLPLPTPGNGASPLFRDLASRFCSILNMARLVPKNRTPCKNWWRDSQKPIHKKIK